jgi:hypothetical protein
MPLHSLALHDDMSVLVVKAVMKPSEQNPFAHFCPMGHWPLERHGSLAEPPPNFFPLLITLLPDGLKTLTNKNTAKTTSNTRPIPDVSFNAIPSDDMKENA